jgi:hypothetical protein
MSTMSKVVASTKKAVMMKPHRPGVIWSSDTPSRNEGVGSGDGVVARATSK